MLRSAVFFGLVLSTQIALAREIVIVSDMDDTTRMANIEKKVKAGAKLFVGVKPYEGLRAIYQELAQNPEVKFYYLSNSFPFLYDGVRWKRKHGFPKGVVLQRSLGDKSDSFKPAKLKEIAKAHPQASFILVGDNVEHDPKFYQDFVKTHPELDTRIFIRDARLIFPQSENITYFQTEAQIVDELEISAETAELIRKLPFQKLVPKFLVNNLRRRLIRTCKAPLLSCRAEANARVKEVIEEITPR